MSNKTTKRRRGARIARHAPSDDTARLYKRAGRVQTLSIALSGIFLLLQAINQRVRDSVLASSNITYVPYVCAWLVLGILNMHYITRQDALKGQLQTQSPEYMSVLRIKIIIASVACSLCVLGFLYLVGAHYWIWSVIRRYVPQASKMFMSFLARLIEWIASGIVGTYAYQRFEKARQQLLRKMAARS
jgi:hypothetical protein